MTFGSVAKWVWAIGGPSHTTQKPSGIGPPGTQAGAKWAHVRSGEASKPNRFRSYVHPTRWIPEKTFPFVCISHTVNLRNTFSFLCTSHIVNPGKTFPFVCTSHTVNPGKMFSFVCTSQTSLCLGSCVIRVTITHALPWLIVCFYQLHHTRFDEKNCVALGYSSQALLLLEPFAKFHDPISRFISLQLIILVLRKFTFHIEQLFANFISGT